MSVKAVKVIIWFDSKYFIMPKKTWVKNCVISLEQRAMGIYFELFLKHTILNTRSEKFHLKSFTKSLMHACIVSYIFTSGKWLCKRKNIYAEFSMGKNTSRLKWCFQSIWFRNNLVESIFHWLYSAFVCIQLTLKQFLTACFLLNFIPQRVQSGYAILKVYWFWFWMK